MKINRLELCAFGPFANKEIIDFTHINEKSIFLISGPTGAGKTTIFDAIAYALYSNASSKDRDGDSMRSDYVGPDIATYVELEFTIRGGKYIVRRSPAQNLNKLKGEGVTRKAMEVTLTLDNGDVLSKNSQVKEKIKSLIGIEYEQFRQTVMLPQGEFRKLLNASSKDREEIFRAIFDTHIFYDFTMKLKSQVKTIEKHREEVTQKIKGIIDLIQEPSVKLHDEISNEYIDTSKVLIALNNDIDDIKTMLDEKVKIKDSLDKDLTKITKAIEKANQDNILIQKRDAQKILYEELLEQDEDNKELKNRIRLINLAKEVVPMEKDYFEKKKILDKTIVDIKTNEINLKNAKVDFEIKTENYDKIDSFRTNLEESKRRRNDLLTTNDDIKKLLPKADLLTKYTAENKRFQGSINDIKRKIENLKKEIIEKDKILNKLLDVDVKYQQQLNHIENISNNMKILSSLSDLYDEYSNTKVEYVKQYELFVGIKSDRDTGQKEFDSKKDVFYRSQAGILASQLIDNAPCPVCGSLSHPNITECLDGFSYNDFEKLEKSNNQQLKEFNIKEKKLNSTISIIEAYKKQIAKYLMEQYDTEISIDNINEFIQDITKTNALEKNECDALFDTLVSQKKQKATAENKRSINHNNKEEQEQILNHYVEKQQELNISIIELSKEVQLLEDKIPAKYLDNNLVENEIKDLSKNIDKINQTIHIYNNEYNNANINIATLEANLKSSINNFISQEKRYNNAKDIFIKQVSNRFENKELYKELRLQINHIEKKEQEYNDYITRLNESKTLYNKMKDDTKNITIFDISELVIKADSIEVNLIQANKIVTKYMSTKSSLSNIYKNIAQLSNQLLDSEDEYKRIKTLADISDGNNSLRISFERYVLASYFNQIISEANIKLKEMTNSKYTLLRKVEKGKGGGHQGLDLLVYDSHTGKARDAKTLSGGEAFKASLALALALATVVQMNYGGINLDTLFVDEGFGTLDPQSLESALEVLVDIKNTGRVVGVISHVSELKSRIDAKIEIETSASGSRIKT